MKLGCILVLLPTGANGIEDLASVWAELRISRQAEGLQVIGCDEASWHGSMILGSCRKESKSAFRTAQALRLYLRERTAVTGM